MMLYASLPDHQSVSHLAEWWRPDPSSSQSAGGKQLGARSRARTGRTAPPAGQQTPVHSCSSHTAPTGNCTKTTVDSEPLQTPDGAGLTTQHFLIMTLHHTCNTMYYQWTEENHIILDSSHDMTPCLATVTPCSVCIQYNKGVVLELQLRGNTTDHSNYHLCLWKQVQLWVSSFPAADIECFKWLRRDVFHDNASFYENQAEVWVCCNY